MTSPSATGVPPIQRDDYADLTNLYLMRVACRTGVYDSIPRILRFESAFRAAIGPLRDKGYKEDDIVQLMEMHLEELEAKPPQCKGPLFDNLRLLADRLGLSAIEQQVLAFRVMTRTCLPLEENLQGLGPLSETRLAGILAIGLGLDEREIAGALEPQSRLLNSGLMNLDQMLQPFLEKLALAPGLANSLLKRHSTVESLVSFAVSMPETPRLCIDDYAHMREDVLLISRYLRSALNCRQKGVNVLMYGEPGTGKTQLAKVIASELKVAMYEVAVEGWEKRPHRVTGRYYMYRLNQSLFKQQGNTLILFDEAEDALRNVLFVDPVHTIQESQGKAWTNRLLEENPVPTFWIANTLDFIDPALLRRFDYILEMRNPPQSVRRRILASSLDGLTLPAGWVERQAQEEKLTPAFTDRAAKVVRMADISEPDDIARHFERIVRNQIEARHDNISARYPIPENYSLALVNASTDLHAVCRTLSARRKGRLLLYGPPGTGKTAFAHHLAQTLDRPLVIKRASDILSPWLGETEKNMVRMFRDASSDEAVLLLDEADSFLQDRRDAVRSWEITQVNELLTQMESFDGLFLCATNFRENLDSAAMRRFGLKVRFDYLNQEQAWQMFAKTLMELGMGDLPAQNEARLKREIASLSNLAPGDFTAARQCLELMEGNDCVDHLLHALQDECRLKPEGGRLAIGFV